MLQQGYEGEKSAHPEPRVPRHSMTVPMPAVLPNWQGQYEVPQDIQSWKGSIFSIFSKHAANWNGSGYGPLLMTPAVSYPHSSTCHALHRKAGAAPLPP